jgi:carbon starvation protein
MSSLIVVLICFGCLGVAYALYSKLLSAKVLAADLDAETPAHELADGKDFVPSNRYVLFGHHFASIAGLGPIVGPAIAVIWGWLPALIWIVLGSIFIGAVHDYTTLVVSLRNKGRGIGIVTGDIIGSRARLLFLIVIFFLLALAMGVFVLIIGLLLSRYPQAVMPTMSLMLIAIAVGFFHYRRKLPILPLAIGGFVLSLFMVWVGLVVPIQVGENTWKIVLLAYAYLASVLPVWILLQPRDFLNSFQLYLALILVYLGILVVPPAMGFAAVRPAAEVANLPPLFPFLFITIACGAVSGFHNLVSTGTTVRQLNKGKDARMIGYGAMLGEAVLAIAVVVAAVHAISSDPVLHARFTDWGEASKLDYKLQAFVDGAAGIMGGYGIPVDFGKTFIAVITVAFALTTLDSGTRLLRYNFEALGTTLRVKPLGNRYLSTVLAVLSIGFFAFYRGMGIRLWQMFGTTNQLLAAIGLLVVTVYLYKRRKPTLYTLLPMVFMLVMTLYAMVVNLQKFLTAEDKNYPLIFVSIAILIMAVWLCVEAFIAFVTANGRRRAESETVPDVG